MDMFVRNIAGGNPLQVTFDPSDEVSPRWSPKNTYLAYAADPGTGTNIYLASPLGGTPPKLLAETHVPSLERFVETELSRV